jgi:hypothetical protein
MFANKKYIVSIIEVVLLSDGENYLTKECRSLILVDNPAKSRATRQIFCSAVLI